MRVRELGAYKNGKKWNILLAVSGEDAANGVPARRWEDVWLVGGTTAHKMLQFVTTILNDIGPANGNNFYVFTMDNLNSHKNRAVVALIHLYGHGIVYRAPYWAVDGSIEFVFNTMLTFVRGKMYQIMNGNDLVAAIYQSIQSIDDFASYFENVGFVI